MADVPRSIGGYAIIRRLGADEGGELFLARARDADGMSRSVVVRLLPETQPGVPVDPAVLQRLRLAVERSHPAMVGLLDVAVDGGRVFLVLEYVQGCNLEVLAAGAPGGLTDDLVGFFGREVCLALEALHGRPGLRGHGRPVVHGAISARSILLSRAGDVKLACIEGAEAPVGELPPDPRDDLFALAAALRPWAPSGTAVAGVVARATSPNPEARYQNAGAMRLALDVACRGSDGQNPRERRRRDEARRAQVAALVALATELGGSEPDPPGLIPIERYDFRAGPGSLFIEVEEGEQSTDEAGRATEPPVQRRDRRTLEILPNFGARGRLESDGTPLPEALEVARPVSGRRASVATGENMPLEVGSVHDLLPTPRGRRLDVDTQENPAARDLGLSQPEIPLPDAPAEPAPEPAPPAAVPPAVVPPGGATGRRTTGRGQAPLVSVPAFRLLVVALAVLVSLLVALGFLLVERGRREAERELRPRLHREARPAAAPEPVPAVGAAPDRSAPEAVSAAGDAVQR